MKITGVKSYTVRVPTWPGAWHSPEFGPPGWDEPTIVLLRVETDAGIVGLGEVQRGIPDNVVQRYVPQIIGLQPLDLNLQALPLGAEFDAAPGIYEAFEMAIYDIVGKAREMPVYKLLGGAYRDRVSVSLCSGQMTPRDAADLARRAADRGYSFVKQKATDQDPVVERIAAIHKAVGAQVKVVIDPMQRLRRPAVVDDLCLRLMEYRDNVQCLEDPVDRGNLDWYVMLRQKVHFPIVLHLGPARAVVEAIKAEACDYLNLGGGMANFHRTATLAASAGIPCWHGSGVGLGVSEAAIVHAAAAAQACTLSSDVVGENLRQNDLIEHPIEIREGHALVPQAPGLGVELDEAALEQYGVRAAAAV
jgi:muconate cycloisomerase